MMRLSHLVAPSLALSLACAATQAAAQMPWTGSIHDHYTGRAERPLGFSQSVSGRFGVQMWRDSISGEMRSEPLAELSYFLHWRHQTDAGWNFGLSLGVGAGNMRPPGNRAIVTGR